MSKKVAILVGILILLLVAAGWVASYFFRSSAPLVNVPEVRITPENFEEEVSKLSLVQELPEKGALLLKFYDFKDGERIFTQSYVLKASGVEQGTLDAPDLALLLHAKYLDTLTNYNFCNIIEQAKSNGDLGIETGLSKTALAWKYRSMAKYRDCLGF